MIDNFNIMFNEVYSVLNLLGREYIYKLPNNVYEFIKNERVPNYEFNINMERDITNFKRCISVYFIFKFKILGYTRRTARTHKNLQRK